MARLVQMLPVSVVGPRAKPPIKLNVVTTDTANRWYVGDVDVQQYDSDYSLAPDELFQDNLNWHYRSGISGMGENVTAQSQPPIRQSTVFGVVGGSALLVAASVALWAYFRKG